MSEALRMEEDFGRRQARSAAAGQFCADNAAQAASALSFLNRARPCRAQYNARCTKLLLGLRLGGRKVSVQVPIVDRDPRYNYFETGDWRDAFLLALLRSFGLEAKWLSFKRQQRFWTSNASLLEELRRRGGKSGLDAIDSQLSELLQSGEPQRKRDERRRQGELNRALAFLRRARKLGATSRQMKKLVSQIMAEEAVLEVQNG